MKILESKIAQARALREEGKTYRQIGEIMGEFQSTIQYWLISDYRSHKINKEVERYKKMSKREKKERTKKHYPYLKKYIKNRYDNDEDFRKKHISRVIKSQQKKKK